MQLVSNEASTAGSWAEQLAIHIPQSAPLTSAFFEQNPPQNYPSELFSSNYQSAFSVEQALSDLHLLDQLNQTIESMEQYSKQDTDADSAPCIEMSVASQLIRVNETQNPTSTGKTCWKFRIFRADQAIALSDILPLLEDFGFRVIGETAYQIGSEELGKSYYMHAFELELSNVLLDGGSENEVASQFESAFLQVWEGRIASDNFNQLLFCCGLGWRHIDMFRAYSNYMKQIGLPYTRPSIANALGAYPVVTALLARYFDVKFDPSSERSVSVRNAELDEIRAEIHSGLDLVTNLTDDRILRNYLQLLNATLRTSFFKERRLDKGEHCLAFKFDASAISNLPKPKPKYEIFVFDKRVQGVHLRGGKVARGGLRWSDRFEDFRTEVLGLVKAQQVKNAVIVPMGAKGGFVCGREPENDSRQAFIDNGVFCYKLFINSLLCITDNLVEGEVVKPEQTVCWDDDDPYFVVAADKGTATFSDIANEISAQRKFWLGDAFASGGSVGYDHKAMGITARGAWVAVQRHFQEIGIDVQSEEFTAVAIGDMAGDVFGNGMLCSDKTKLLAAFNHAHIFLDPSPDASASFAERQRLFDSVSGWEEYDQSLISQGGGIFSRNAKSVPLSQEVKAWLGTTADELTPTQLIHTILKAKVDLLWNGGIGTYIKSSDETHADVGDRANNDLRVNGNEVGAAVFGEGGNLGASQLGRVEYCLQGGRCNTDFIDNAGGVDCSDHEVNIKILLGELVSDQTINACERNEMLFEMTEEVSELVLHNNYRQTQAISMIEREAKLRALEYQRLIADLEKRGILDRAIEFIPDEEALVERKSRGQSLTRPEISVLVSYAKLAIKSDLLESNVFDDTLVKSAAAEAFPERIRSTYGPAISEHRLNKEIIATQVAGNIVNRMGINFVQRMQEATGESVESIVKAYIATVEIFDVEVQWQAIEQLDGKIDAQQQYKLFADIVRLVRRSTRWLLRRFRSNINSEQCADRYRQSAEHLTSTLSELLQGDQQAAYVDEMATYRDIGIPERLANFVAASRHLYNTFAIQRIVEDSTISLPAVCSAYFTLGESLKLNWFADRIVTMPVENYWQALARESFRDELESQQAELTVNWLANLGANATVLDFSAWSQQHQAYIDRWTTMMNELLQTQDMDIAMYPVALRELLDLVQASTTRATSDAA